MFYVTRTYHSYIMKTLLHYVWTGVRVSRTQSPSCLRPVLWFVFIMKLGRPCYVQFTACYTARRQPFCTRLYLLTTSVHLVSGAHCMFDTRRSHSGYTAPPWKAELNDDLKLRVMEIPSPNLARYIGAKNPANSPEMNYFKLFVSIYLV